ncbi:MAG: FAD-dependent oxidoreductase [Kiloniellales bacterium]
MTEVLVVGGGLLGVTTAHRLAKRGCSVTLLEAGEKAGEGACFANGAMICPSHSDPWNRPGVLGSLLRSFVERDSAIQLRLTALPGLISWGRAFLANATPERNRQTTQRLLALAQHSVQSYGSDIDAHGGAFDAVRSGTMKVFRSQEPLDAHIAANTRLKDFGLAFEVLDRAGTIATEPQLAPIADALVGALRYPGDIVADARKYCQFLLGELSKMGARVEINCRVKSLIEKGEAICGVSSTKGDFEAEHVVLTLGADPHGLAKQAGLRLPIRPVKGYSITYDTSALNAKPGIPVIDDALHVGAIPLGDRLRVAGSVDFAGFDRSIRPERIALLESILGRVYPELIGALQARGGQPWTGLRPMSSDGLPCIGRGHRPGLWVNAGHGHLGWTLAGGSAELLADLLTGKAPAVNPDWYAVTR